MILAQYYNLLRLGRKGYARIATNVLENARYVAERLADSGRFEVLNTADLLPIVTVKLKEDAKYTVFDLSHKLRERGWIVPAYTLPPNAEDIAIMRVVVKENFGRDLADIFVADVANVCEVLEGAKGEVVVPRRSARRGHHVN